MRITSRFFVYLSPGIILLEFYGLVQIWVQLLLKMAMLSLQQLKWDPIAL